MACSCPMTMLNPNLLFIIARRHIIHTWISSVASPIFNLVECLNCLAILGPSKSLLWWLAFLSELLPKRGFLDMEAEPFILILQSSLPELDPRKKSERNVWIRSKQCKHFLASIYILKKCSISYKNSKLFYSSHHSQNRRKNRNTKIHMHWCAAFWQDFVSWWENKGVEEKMGKSRKKQLFPSWTKLFKLHVGMKKSCFSFTFYNWIQEYFPSSL